MREGSWISTISPLFCCAGLILNGNFAGHKAGDGQSRALRGLEQPVGQSDWSSSTQEHALQKRVHRAKRIVAVLLIVFLF